MSKKLPRVLVIDNETKHINTLTTVLKEYYYEIVSFRQMGTIEPEEYDLILLTGGSSFSIVHHDYLYRNEISLIRRSSVPIIGICLGCELIAYSFGAKLEYLQAPISGYRYIEIIGDYKNLQFLENTQVYESHKWAIKVLPENLEVLARSSDGIEILRDKSARIYGFQFHPEVSHLSTQGNMLNHLIKRLLSAH